MGGGRRFDIGEDGSLSPSIEVGLRDDAGAAECGTGVELGAGVKISTGGLSAEAKARRLVAHAACEEWGASLQFRLPLGRTAETSGSRCERCEATQGAPRRISGVRVRWIRSPATARSRPSSGSCRDRPRTRAPAWARTRDTVRERLARKLRDPEGSHRRAGSRPSEAKAPQANPTKP